jgi:hypothetical protein
MPSFGLSARSTFFISCLMIIAATTSGYLNILIKCSLILSATVLTIGFTVPVIRVPRLLRPTFFFIMVRVYHLLLLGLRPYWRIKDLLRTVPRLELQLQFLHSDVTHLVNLAPAQVQMHQDVAVFAEIMARMLQAAIATREQLAAQTQAIEALSTAMGLARTAHQTSNEVLLSMSEGLRLLTSTLRDIGQDSEVTEAITLLREIHADARYTRLVAEVDDPALQRPSASPASRNSAPPVFGPNSPRYIPSSPTTAPPFAPLALESFSPPRSLSPLPLPLPAFFGAPVAFTAPAGTIPDTPSTAIEASPSPHASPTSDTFAADEPDLRINYNIPVHYYPSQQENDSFIQWELEDWELTPYSNESFMIARRGPSHHPRFMAITLNGHRIVAPTKREALRKALFHYYS